MNWRAVAFWLLGTLAVFFGALVAGNVDAAAIGSTTASVTLAYIISFILILVGGMLWISTAIAHIEEQ